LRERCSCPPISYALDRVLELATSYRAAAPFFAFCNLYDVHAPYAPTVDSMLRPWAKISNALENLVAPVLLASLGRHEYLRPGFRLSERNRSLLQKRYRDAIILMDAKLARLWEELEHRRILEDTCVVLCSDHGEAFGDHGLYLHDASVYETHIHVPLWIHHPDCVPSVVEEVVSLRDLFTLIRSVGSGGDLRRIILDEGARHIPGVAIAQYFYYPHMPNADAKFKQNLMAAVSNEVKVTVRSDGIDRCDLLLDPDERAPVPGDVLEFRAQCRREGTASSVCDEIVTRFRDWAERKVA
jgi:arylsulfatase A-like enzyme